MSAVWIRTTTRAISVAAAIALASCGASDKEIKRARTSGYEADFAIVYGQTLAAVSKLYPHLSREDAVRGSISTKWHPIHIINEGTDDGLTQQQRDQLAAEQRSNPMDSSGRLAPTSMVRTRYFIRFDVRVIGGKPWRVIVESQASKWELGAVPVELKGADAPHWLKGRTDKLYLAIYDRLAKYAVQLKSTEVDEADVKEARKVDTSAYGSIPAPAAERVDSVVVAAEKRDFTALRSLMADEFQWSLGGSPSAEQAINIWQADSSVLVELAKVLKQGCVAESDEKVTCPKAFSEQVGYLGYRAGFEFAGGDWKMTFFLRGN